MFNFSQIYRTILGQVVQFDTKLAVLDEIEYEFFKWNAVFV